jgi:hypothetical protein
MLAHSTLTLTRRRLVCLASISAVAAILAFVEACAPAATPSSSAPTGGSSPVPAAPAEPTRGGSPTAQAGAAGSTTQTSSPPKPAVPAPADAAKTPQPGPAKTSANEFAASQQAGDLKVDLLISPFSAGRNPTTLEVTLADSDGKPVGDAQVSFDLTMPAMPMPSNKPTAQAAGDGRYTASARMGMAGEWWITVIIRQGGKEQRVTFKGAWVR